VVSGLSERAELWAEAANGSKWRRALPAFVTSLPLIPPQEEVLFEI
jgi:hypothetical protein